MIYLSGAIRAELIGREDMGFMATMHKSSTLALPCQRWAADTGCFTQPARYSDAVYLRWLDPLPRGTNLFATAPDVVGDASATWGRAEPMLPRLRAMGFRAALVGQDGMEHLPVEWGAFDCLFIGGSTEWKLSEAAYDLVREAKRRGKWTHMGRVNSLRRYRAAAISGYDSVDGTYLTFGPDKNLPRLQGWIDSLRTQPALEVSA